MNNSITHIMLIFGESIGRSVEILTLIGIIIGNYEFISNLLEYNIILRNHTHISMDYYC